MAKILCATSGLTGITNASLELLARLKNEGHDILYVSPKDIKEKVVGSGFDYHQLPQILNEPKLEIPAFSGIFRKIKRFLYKVQNRNKLRRSALMDLRPGSFERICDEYKPAVTLLDVELHEYIMYSSSQDMRLILLSQWFTLWERPGSPYLLYSTVPGIGLLGSKLGIWLSWRKVRIQRWFTFFRKNIRSAGTDRRSTLLGYANEVGFNKNYISENNWPGPFVYNTLPVISMTMSEMEFPHEHQPNLYYVGPMVYEGRKENTLSVADSLKMNQILDLKKEKGKQIIYCSVSTLHSGDQAFMERVIKAIGGYSGWILVLSMGGLVDQDRFANVPPNVYLLTYVPQLKILEHTACSINHGGIHTINECIHYQVPMLVYSGKRSDQNGCAARVAYHELGLMADKDLDTSEIIRSKVEKVLANPRYKENMNLMSKKYLSYKSNRSIEEYIVKSLNNKS